METETEVEIKPSGDRNVKIVRGEEFWCSGKSSEYLGISKVYLLYLAKQNRISCLRHAGNVLFKKEYLDDYIDDQTFIRPVANIRRKK